MFIVVEQRLKFIIKTDGIGTVQASNTDAVLNQYLRR
jgi:hypothetical protein